jgi:HPt (histidine-containing phosphotransfer) domain-containing protein
MTPNLKYIEQISGGDLEFQKKIINIIKKEFPHEKEQYQENFKSKKYTQLAMYVHKIKHKINIFGLNESYKIAMEYEKNLKNNSTKLSAEFDLILKAITSFLEKH